MDKVALYSVHHTSVPVGYPCAVYHIKIIVSSVHKGGHKTPLRQIVYNLLFGFAAVKYISEIAAYYQYVAAFKPSEIAVVQPFKTAVHIACYVYRNYHLPKL